ncbi:hypothetical protein G4H13_45405 [Streptomyces rapamycinicus]|uniref:Carbohydrate kinase FGGY N-terminal domain-containing protein n=1 Tax=Streptomyces rhizosphaericus TaxID=114699 RepID=A0A6G4AVU5_9ACTN|nr:hypothetical protein [Streptomyces rhizosphaericus]
MKAAVIDEKGDVLGAGSSDSPLLHPHPDWVEARPGDYWRATVRSTRSALQGARCPTSRCCVCTAQHCRYHQ